MLNRKLSSMLKIVYYHMLAFSLAATTLDLHNPLHLRRKPPRIYFVYTFFCSCLLTAQVYHEISYKNNIPSYYEDSKILLALLPTLIVLRILTLFGCYGLVWLGRRQLLEVYDGLAKNWRTYNQALKRAAGASALERLQLQLAVYLQRKIIICYVWVTCSTIFFWQLVPKANLANMLHMFGDISFLIVLLIAKTSFFTLLLVLDHQFESINLSLQNIYKYLERREPATWHRSLSHLRQITSLHYDTYKLSRRIFQICDLTNATFYLQIFGSTVNVLYHAVLYRNATIKSNIWDMLIGNCLIICNFWNSSMEVNLLDRTLSACNDAGQCVRQFSHLRLMNSEFQLELELFANRLRAQKLVYKICGCVELNRPACLSYIVAVLVHVILLIQFDLSLKYNINQS